MDAPTPSPASYILTYLKSDPGRVRPIGNHSQVHGQSFAPLRVVVVAVMPVAVWLLQLLPRSCGRFRPRVAVVGDGSTNEEGADGW